MYRVKEEGVTCERNTAEKIMLDDVKCDVERAVGYINMSDSFTNIEWKLLPSSVCTLLNTLQIERMGCKNGTFI